jgi:hypothetical protein
MASWALDHEIAKCADLHIVQRNIKASASCGVISKPAKSQAQTSLPGPQAGFTGRPRCAVLAEKKTRKGEKCLEELR